MAITQREYDEMMVEAQADVQNDFAAWLAEFLGTGHPGRSLLAPSATPQQVQQLGQPMPAGPQMPQAAAGGGPPDNFANVPGLGGY